MFDDMIGRKVTVKIKTDEYNGRTFRLYKHITLTELLKVDDGYLLRLENTGFAEESHGKFVRIVHSNEILEIFPIGTRF